MEYLLNGSEMKELDRYVIRQIGIPSLVLMENAARAAAEEIEKCSPAKILIVAGVGNNGADGLCIYRILRLKGYSCDCIVVGDEEKATDEFRAQKRILEQLSLRLTDACDYQGYDLIADALFGIGLTRDITGIFAQAIEKINRSGAKICSIDIPSGVSSDRGTICGIAVNADFTVTFGYLKTGMLCYPGKSLCGTVFLKDIGYPPQMGDTPKVMRRYCTKQDLYRLPKRVPDGHKGTFGKILLIAGSEQYTGAALLACRSAYRTGVGMVKVVTHFKNRDVLCSQIPEALFLLYGEEKHQIPYSEEFVEELEKSVAWADVIAIGPGLSTDLTAEHLLFDILEKSGNKRLVLDADALNLLAEQPSYEKYLDAQMILTPHIMEFSRLLKCEPEEIKENPEYYATRFARQYGCTVVLKDAVSIITDGEKVVYNSSGNNGMGVAGSGDVLTGILGALSALGMSLFQTAVLGAFIHGTAGDMAAEKNGTRYLLPTDIIDELSFLKDFQ